MELNNKKKHEDTLNFYDKKGKKKKKKDFLNEAEQAYDKFSKIAEEREAQEKEVAEKSSTEEDAVAAAKEMLEQMGMNDFSVLSILCSPEFQIEPDVVLNTFDFESRAIYFDEEITVEMASDVIRKVRLWNYADKMDKVPLEDRDPIKFYINTPGGDITAVFSIIGAMEMSKTPIYTITYGCGYSGGFFIGICGDKRYGFPHSSFLFHEGMTIDGGDAHKFLQHVDFYKQQLRKLKEITITKTKITSEEYEERKKDDWFFSTSEAIHYGIIDEVLDTFEKE